MVNHPRGRVKNAVEGNYFNAWFIISIVITVFLIFILAWHLVYSNEMIESFEQQELAVQQVSGQLQRYTDNLEMAAKMAAATGDLQWEIDYNDYRSRLDEVFDRIPELVATEEAREQIERTKTYRAEIDAIEEEALSLVARGQKREAADLLAGWVYTGNQLEVIVATENLASIMNAHINERIAYEQRLTRTLLWILAACLFVLIISWWVTIKIWRTSLKKKKEKDQEVKYLSYHDALTGLLNRAFLEEEMARVEDIAYLPVSIIMLDFNNLKLVNDTYGHSAGDQVLKKGAELLKRNCRDDDILARWGGDEFVILLPRTDEKSVQAINSRIINECRKTYTSSVPVSMALGSVTRVSQGQDIFKCLKQAEDRMYDHKLSEGRNSRSAALKGLLATLERKSYETESHYRCVEKMSRLIGEEMELPESEIDRLSMLARVHDIGMIDIPDQVLGKSAPLTEEEWEMIKKHPETGYRIARSSKELAHIAEGILNHHEKWDGSGYPEGLRGTEISLLARIVAVADAFEVMSSGRPYKKAMTREEIIVEFRKCSGSQFDPGIVKVLIKILEDENTFDASTPLFN